jgi:hypothetical protein
MYTTRRIETTGASNVFSVVRHLTERAQGCWFGLEYRDQNCIKIVVIQRGNDNWQPVGTLLRNTRSSMAVDESVRLCKTINLVGAATLVLIGSSNAVSPLLAMRAMQFSAIDIFAQLGKEQVRYQDTWATRRQMPCSVTTEDVLSIKPWMRGGRHHTTNACPTFAAMPAPANGRFRLVVKDAQIARIARRANIAGILESE